MDNVEIDRELLRRPLEVCLEIAEDASVSGHPWHGELKEVLEEVDEELDTELEK